ncbi:hypothetical protein [Gluconobacter albidus]|uniref:DNA methylase adenine-specific domain-containing protein n=1 Tax=Gluconobacter albidus TaxID=318683 RepID=A0AAW3R081_9PROT|nr:hypothetical protein [Gluconobacter albidus]KXV43717.1 hypothetical protein AD941_00315 [Gluconobacter albidus]GBQ90716.1 hypothetical protein AA3250_2111 [Gluconobacter albidus NBRC 3250]GLQ69495.1 hypothetical protein GCM10007866_19470 [Gluconobacter albidus]
MNVYEFNKGNYDNFRQNGNVPDFVKDRHADGTDKGEVYTPADIINKMLDMSKPEDWSNPDITMLEPSCGNGRFVIEMIKRFMDGLEQIIPNESERFKHILENQVYAGDIQMDSVLELYNNIEYIFGSNCLDGVKANIICTDMMAFPAQNWHMESSLVTVKQEMDDKRDKSNIDIDKKIKRALNDIHKLYNNFNLSNKVKADKITKKNGRLNELTNKLIDMYDNGEYVFEPQIQQLNYMCEVNSVTDIDEVLKLYNINDRFTRYMIRLSQ